MAKNTYIKQERRLAARPRSERLRSAGVSSGYGEASGSLLSLSVSIRAHAADSRIHVTDAERTSWNLVSSLFDIDADGNVYVTGDRGFYSNSFVSARGSDPEAGSGAGGLDVDELWSVLGAAGTEKIDASHIPSLSQLSGTLGNAQLANSSVTIAGVAVALGGAVSTAQIASALTAAGYKLTDTIYTLPKATVSALGGIKAAGVRTSAITTTQGGTTSGRYYGVELDSNGKAFVNVPWVNTTYSLSSFGITATAAEINKLDGLATTATELGYVHGVTSAIQTQLNGKANASALAAYALKDGSNASGTWPISISGNAASATNATNLAGVAGTKYLYHLRKNRYNIDTESTLNPRVLEINNPEGTPPTSNAWLQVLTWGSGDSGYGTQLANQYNIEGSLYFRNKVAGTWKPWRTLIDTSNYTNFTLNRDAIVSTIGVSGTDLVGWTYNGVTRSRVTQAQLRTMLGLGSNAYTSTVYLPLAGGTMTGALTISTSGCPLYIQGGSSVESYMKVRLGGTDKSAFGYNSSFGTFLYSYTYGGYLSLTDSGLARIYKGSSLVGTLWHSGNDGSGSGLDADLLDGTQKSGLLTSVASTAAANLSVTVGGTTKSVADLYATYLDGKTGVFYRTSPGHYNYINITVGGDAGTYYPVVIQRQDVFYPATLLNITRRYDETAPDSWNTSTHKGGLTMCILWNSSIYWDGNGSGGVSTTRVLMLEQTYSTMVGGIDSSTSGLVVWLRGGTATYHIYSNKGAATTATVYLNGFTDSVPRTFSPKTTPSSISAYQSLGVTALSAERLYTSRTLWGKSFDGSGNVAGAMIGVGLINGALYIAEGDDIVRLGTSNHVTEFHGYGYINKKYYFRPGYSSAGATTAAVYIQNASASDSPEFTTTHAFDANGTATHSGELFVGSSITSGGHLFMRAATGRFIFNSRGSGFMMSMENGNFRLMSHNTGSFVARLAEVDMSGNVGIKAAPASGYALNVAGAGYFGELLRANAGVQIGGTADIGWYKSDSRLVAGASVARGVNVGDLLVSNAWADMTKVPTNGIYSKGAVLSDSYLQVGSGRLRWDAANNALYVEKSDGTACGLYSTGFLSSHDADPGAGTAAGADTGADVPQYDLLRPRRLASQTCYEGSVTDTTVSPNRVLTVSDQPPMLRFRGGKPGDGWSVEVYVRTSGGKNSKYRRVLTAPISECTADSSWKNTVYESVVLPWSLMRIFFEKFDPTEGRFHSTPYVGATVGAAWANLVANSRKGSGVTSFTSIEKKRWYSPGGDGGSIRSQASCLYAYAHFGVRLANDTLGVHGDMKTFTISLRKATSSNLRNNDLSFTMRTD